MIPREMQCAGITGNAMLQMPEKARTQTHGAAQDKNQEVKQNIKVFKRWFLGIVALCAAVIIGSAIFYSMI